MTDLLAPDRVIARLNVTSRRRALQRLAEKASSVIGHPEASIAAALRARERLGSTGIGNGVAIPHARLPDLHGLFGLFARLDHPIDFAAVDSQPVDLLFLILAPASPNAGQLGALRLMLRLLRNEDLCNRLRHAPDSRSLFSLLDQFGAASLETSEWSSATAASPRERREVSA